MATPEAPGISPISRFFQCRISSLESNIPDIPVSMALQRTMMAPVGTRVGIIPGICWRDSFSEPHLSECSGTRSEALECGSKLPLCLEPACWRGTLLQVEIPASKLAGRKAAASCRTPKLDAPTEAVENLVGFPSRRKRRLK